jgi:lipopolysaccharide biosynthesis glycosyltransferase
MLFPPSRNMTEYEAVGLLDGDTILVGSVSQPFDFLHMSDYPLAAVPDISGPGGGPRHLEIKNNLNAGGEPAATLPQKMIPAHQVLTSSALCPVARFSAMWAKTNATLFNELVEASKHTATYDPRFPEQNFLTRFFSGRWLGLDVGYNLMLLYVKDGRRKYYDRVRPHAKVLHYAADSKPWRRCLRGNMHLCMIDHLRWVKNVRDAMDEVGVTPADFAAAGWKLQPVFDATAAKIADLLPGDRA